MQGNIETRVGIFVLAAISIFIYMGFQIGAFRFDRGRYNMYTMYFTDITGLSRKADVTIAGVKVGWVEKITLLADGDLKAKTEAMILKDYNLYTDAYALVRQDGLLGPKYIEVIPGDPLLRKLEAEETLSRPSREPVAIDELLQQFKDIASNVEQVTDSFKQAVGGPQGKEFLRETFDNLHQASQKMASFSDVLERSFTRNEDNIDTLLQVGNDIHRITDRLDQKILPTFQDGIERISDVFDRDFNRIATRLEATGEALEEASVQARDGLHSISSVAEKIDEGKGLLGKLVNEDETYQDLRVAVQGFKNYLTKIDRLQIIFDSHSETMLRPAENYQFEDSKGYFNMRIHPNEDHFYLIQIASSEKGWRWQKETEHLYRNREHKVNCRPIVDKDRLTTNRPKDIFIDEKTTIRRNGFRFGLQFGKIFKNVAFRFGLFEGFAGVGLDVDLPFRTDKFRWVTSLEVFDFSGWNRIDDRRPHLKWLNKMFIMRNLYFTFGADDFASKRNASGFIGLGLRFGDDDVKYLLSSLSGASGAGGFLQG